ncbi:MAG: hypothetical protein OSB03_19890 [Vicinamibacterales bacterium]|nr:hypothetical protein [Vicinamibacterales bacterium]
MSRLAVPATMTYKVTGVVCLLVAAGCGLALARTATAFAWSTILDYAVDPKHQLLDYRLPNIATTHLVFVVAARGSGRDPRLIFAGQDYDFEGEGYFEICDFDQLAPPAVVQ